MCLLLIVKGKVLSWDKATPSANTYRICVFFRRQKAACAQEVLPDQTTSTLSTQPITPLEAGESWHAVHKAPSPPAQAGLTKVHQATCSICHRTFSNRLESEVQCCIYSLALGPERKCAGKFVNSFLALAETLF